MNKELYNELIEAKGQGTLGIVLREKFAALNIQTEDEMQYLFDCTNEKLANANQAGKEAVKNALSGGKKVIENTSTNDKKSFFGNIKNMSPLGKVIAGLSLAGIAAIPIGGMIARAGQKKVTLDKVLASNPTLKEDKKTKDHYDMLWHVAPNLASNHVIAGSVLEQLKAYDMIDHQMIAKLVEADKNMAEARSKGGMLNNASTIAQTGANLTKMIGESK
jgi:hypothetical protein